jgi:hypothetical protein
MISRKYLIAWMATAAALIGVPLAQGQAQSPYLPESTTNFGNVLQGDAVEHRFMVRNPGTSALRVQIVDLSHPGMKVRMPQQVLPGDVGWITVTWDTRLVQGDTTAEALLRFNDAESAIVSLTAKVIPPIDILPQPAVFISGFRDEGLTRILEIVNNDPAPLNIVAISRESESSARSYSAAFATIEPGRRHQLTVELKSAAPAGLSRDVLLVRTDHAHFPVIRVPVTLFVKDDVYINPQSVDFGQITGKADNHESFLLKTRRGKIKILSVTSDLTFLKVTTAHPDAASATHEFRVETDGELAAGPFSGSIRIRTDDPSFPEVKAVVQGEVLR